MTEKDMQTFFGKYLQENPPETTEVYELKFINLSKRKSLPFNEIKEHQIEGLLDAEQKSLYHRITDQAWHRNRPYVFTKQKPFDCVIFVKVKAFIVLWFYKPRELKIFIKIPILKFIELKLSSNRKSINKETAEKIGQLIHI